MFQFRCLSSWELSGFDNCFSLLDLMRSSSEEMCFVRLSWDLSCAAFLRLTLGSIVIPDVLHVTGCDVYLVPQPQSMVSAPANPTDRAVTVATAPRESKTPPCIGFLRLHGNCFRIISFLTATLVLWRLKLSAPAETSSLTVTQGVCPGAPQRLRTQQAVWGDAVRAQDGRRLRFSRHLGTSPPPVGLRAKRVRRAYGECWQYAVQYVELCRSKVTCQAYNHYCP